MTRHWGEGEARVRVRRGGGDARRGGRGEERRGEHERGGEGGVCNFEGARGV